MIWILTFGFHISGNVQLLIEGQSRGSNDVIRYCTTVPRQTVFDVLALKKFFTDPSIYYKRSKWSEFI